MTNYSLPILNWNAGLNAPTLSLLCFCENNYKTRACVCRRGWELSFVFIAGVVEILLLESKQFILAIHKVKMHFYTWIMSFFFLYLFFFNPLYNLDNSQDLTNQRGSKKLNKRCKKNPIYLFCGAMWRNRGLASYSCSTYPSLPIVVQSHFLIPVNNM